MSRLHTDAKSMLIQRLLLFGSLSTTLAVSAWNFDPINLIKMTILALLAICTLIIHLMRQQKTKYMKKNNNSRFYNLLLLIVFLLLMNLAINNYAFSERLFGVSGRNNGFVTYFSLVVIAYLSSIYFAQVNIVQVLAVISVANVVVVLYYLLQRIGIDPIAVTDVYSRPSSTLGNPNFVAAFLGMTAVVPLSLSFLLRSYRLVIFAVLSVTCSFCVMIDSQSIQGIFTFLFSISAILILLSFKKSKKLGILIALSAFAGGIFLIMVFMGVAVSIPLLASTSFLIRLDYWQVALSMTSANFLMGVGLDGFRDYFRRFRSEELFNRLGENVLTDSPHNMFLEYFTSGGLPLGLAFIGLVSLVYIKTVSYLILIKENIDFGVLSLFALFNGYLIQSLISPTQIGISVWFWLLLGMQWGIVGGNNQNRKSSFFVMWFSKGKEQIINLVPKQFAVGIFLLFIPIVVQPIIIDAKFLTAVKSGDGLSLVKTSKVWPMDSKRVTLVESAIFSDEFNQIKLDVALAGIRHNPNNYELWKAISENSVTPTELASEAVVSLRKIEPRYGNIER